MQDQYPTRRPHPVTRDDDEPTVTIVGHSTPAFERAMADFERWRVSTEQAQRRNQAHAQTQRAERERRR